jgi:hypothetical protein
MGFEIGRNQLVPSRERMARPHRRGKRIGSQPDHLEVVSLQRAFGIRDHEMEFTSQQRRQ